MNNEDEINPWTFRQNNNLIPKKQEEKNQTLQFKQLHYSPFKPLSKNRVKPQYQSLPKTQLLKNLRFPAIVQTKGIQKQPLKSSKVKDYYQILNNQMKSKFIPSNPKMKLSSGANPKNRQSQKNVPYYIKSLRQYTQNNQVLKRKETQNQEHQQIRRYKTEQPLQQHQTLKNSQSKARNQSKARQLQRNSPTIKIINISKNSQRQQTLLSKGKLYNQISHLCDVKGELNSKLSLMKRTYNLKKIQKMIS